MKPVLLTINAGSSSLKLSVIDDDPNLTRLADAEVTAIGTAAATSRWEVGGHREIDDVSGADQARALEVLLGGVERRGWTPASAVHRIVHGGAHHVRPELATPGVLADLEDLVPLAPLHQPHNLRPVHRIAELHPDVPQVLCFDTAFHATVPDVARHFALPRTFLDQGLIRYGFHGLSYEHVVAVLPSIVGAHADGRVVVAHLGAGSSLCAIHGGRSVATTMGFSPIDGVPMATRSGSIDPGALIYLLRSGTTLDELDDLLNNRSGLLGYSGLSADMRTLLTSSSTDAQAAADLYCYRVREAIGALTADLGGLDALVFTGGIGENSPDVRSRVCQGLEWLGVRLDETANSSSAERIDASGASVAVAVVPADEASVLARRGREVLSGGPQAHMHGHGHGGDHAHVH